jgi:hypothetical protein
MDANMGTRRRRIARCQGRATALQLEGEKEVLGHVAIVVLQRME